MCVCAGFCTSNSNKPWQVIYVAQICWQMISLTCFDRNKKTCSSLKWILPQKLRGHWCPMKTFPTHLAMWNPEAWTWFLQSWLHIWLPLHLAYCGPRWSPSTTSAFRTTFGGTNGATKGGHCCSIRLDGKTAKGICFEFLLVGWKMWDRVHLVTFSMCFGNSLPVLIFSVWLSL